MTFAQDWQLSFACGRAQRTFNDGYHVEHHLHSRRHWTEARVYRLLSCHTQNSRGATLMFVVRAQLPGNFMANVDKYAEEDAVVFEVVTPPSRV